MKNLKKAAAAAFAFAMLGSFALAEVTPAFDPAVEQEQAAEPEAPEAEATEAEQPTDKLTQDDAIEAAQQAYPGYTFKYQKTSVVNKTVYYRLQGTPVEGGKITVYVSAEDGTVLAKEEYDFLKNGGNRDIDPAPDFGNEPPTEKADDQNDGQRGPDMDRGQDRQPPRGPEQGPGRGHGPQGQEQGNQPPQGPDMDRGQDRQPPHGPDQGRGPRHPGEHAPEDATSEATPPRGACPQGMMPPQNPDGRQPEQPEGNDQPQDWAECPQGMMPPQNPDGRQPERPEENDQPQDGRRPGPKPEDAPEMMPEMDDIPEDAVSEDEAAEEAETTPREPAKNSAYTIIITDENGQQTTLTVQAADIRVLPAED